MIGKDTLYEIFINIGAERFVDLLRNPWTAEAWIALLQFDDGLDEFGGRPLGGLACLCGRLNTTSGTSDA
jgi:hypothetical protein